jgi:hypothetical protein
MEESMTLKICSLGALSLVAVACSGTMGSTGSGSGSGTYCYQSSQGIVCSTIAPLSGDSGDDTCVPPAGGGSSESGAVLVMMLPPDADFVCETEDDDGDGTPNLFDDDDDGDGVADDLDASEVDDDDCEDQEEFCDDDEGDDDEGEIDLPYDIKMALGETYTPILDAFAEKGAVPTGTITLEMDGSDWRLAELEANTPFTITQEDCDHEGNRDVGRDRVFVTWETPGGGSETDHLDLRYCEE